MLHIDYQLKTTKPIALRYRTLLSTGMVDKCKCEIIVKL
nr:MAG TPA: hypothetical protein [Caudoviricetes sp.]